MKVQDHMISHYPAIYLMAQASCQFVNAYRSWRSNLNLIILLQQYVPQHVANNPLRFANKVYCTTNWLGRQLFRVSPKGLNLRHSKMTNPIYDQWRVTIPTVMVNFFAYDFQLIEACSEHPLPWTSRCFGIERFGFPGGLMNFPWFQLLAKLIGPETSPKNPPKSPLRTFFFWHSSTTSGVTSFRHHAARFVWRFFLTMDPTKNVDLEKNRWRIQKTNLYLTVCRGWDAYTHHTGSLYKLLQYTPEIIIHPCDYCWWDHVPPKPDIKDAWK